MGKKRTPSFILQLPLQTTPKDEKILSVRFRAAKQVYNACLGEILKRLRLMRQSKDYQRARKLKKSKARTTLFKELRDEFGFSDYALQTFATQFRRSWLGEHLDSNTIQKLATRAFQAAKEYAFAQRGCPRFKGKRGLQSVEGKNNTSGIRFSEGSLHWKGLSLSVKLKDKGIIQEYGLMHRVKYCRIVRKTIRGQQRWFVQLLLEGTPWVKPKNKPGKQTVGLDVGPSTIAIVDDEQARLVRFCGELKDLSQRIRRLQRAMDRSRRANNPDNYRPDGTAIKGKKTWNNSNRYEKLRLKKAELERRLAAHRKSLHGELANEVLRRGCVIRSEKVSYKAWQKMFGRSIGKRAPAMFMAILRRKAESAGGGIKDISTYKTALSQSCFCGAPRKKKKLSERIHRCDCGVVAQRDLFSAYLARHVSNNKLDVGKALASWNQGAEALLQAASKQTQIAKRKDFASSHQSSFEKVGQSDSLEKKEMVGGKSQNVVALGPGSEQRESGKATDTTRRWSQLDFPF